MDLNQQQPTEVSYNPDEKSQSVLRTRRVFLKVVFTLTTVLGLAFVTIAYGHLAIVHSKNHAYGQIQYGDHLNRVIERMGEAQEVTLFQYPTNNKIVQRYTYYVYPILLGENQMVRYRWQIDVDESGLVVGFFYSDDAC